MTSIHRPSGSHGPTQPQIQPQDGTSKGQGIIAILIGLAAEPGKKIPDGPPTGAEITAAAGGSPTSTKAAPLPPTGDSFQAASPKSGPFSAGLKQTGASGLTRSPRRPEPRSSNFSFGMNDLLVSS
jgi:hypothetical protein